jgi:hypothetical protein
MTENEPDFKWHRYKNGSKKPDHGKLLYEVKEPKWFLADPSHRTKVYGGGMYGIVKMTKPMHNGDAE